MKREAPVRWPAIAALTAVSTFAQIGQFGMGFVVLPIWLAHQGLDAPRAGLFSAAQWAGMLIGLLVTPELAARFGAKRIVSAGLAATLVAYASVGIVWWPLWIAPGMLMGFGIGLRWIANETWLYRLVPDNASGRVVGVHETLIATSGVIAPGLAAWFGVDPHLILATGAAFTLAAAVPLWLTASGDHERMPMPTKPVRGPSPSSLRGLSLGAIVGLGMAVIAVGGLGDGALYGLFPLYAAARGLDATQTATVLTLFGIGSMALQWPVGWLADRAGLAIAVLVCATLSASSVLAFGFSMQASLSMNACALLLGGMNSAFITLGMVAAARSEAAVLARNMRLLSLTFTASSIVGPLCAGAAMKAAGSDMLIWQLATASAVLAVFTLGLCAGRRQGGANRQSAP
ncbi:MFS transporter [Paraburkholderia sp.]|uniref:MFS transporter n=1 Tax=Paraburkholderia sp. TaxID=1926495 RepID=UPI0023A69608|nr:MFS transporter [Paraburkholderia sp.]MDE1182618.1 MFS transporter [Paraburkholderia sp.]